MASFLMLGHRSSVISRQVESDVLAELVAQIASNALVAAPGIAEEHAGSVGATYNKTGDGITGGVSLLARDKELLTHYRLGTWQ